MMKKKVSAFLYTALSIGVFSFLMMAYGVAYTPPKAQLQRIMCYKFKAGTSQVQVQKHMADFQNLKRELPQIVAYSAGSTLNQNGTSSEYDVMHYLTFINQEELDKYLQSAEFKTFEALHKNDWEKVLVLESAIK